MSAATDVPQRDRGDRAVRITAAAPGGDARLRASNVALFTCLTLFLLFTANLVAGRFAGGSEVVQRFQLSPVMEFLLLFAVAVSFVVAALLREAVEKKDDDVVH